MGIKGGKVVLVDHASAEVSFDLNQVQSIELDGVPKWGDAEQARADDPKKAAALYKQVIASINKPDLKLLAEWRAIAPTEQDGRWSEALALFLDVYHAAPSDGVWKTRPQKWPAAGSEMLNQGADLVAKAIKDEKDDDVQKNLRTYLVEIYNHADRKEDAARLAREITTGIPEPAVDRAVPSPASAVFVNIEALFQKKDFAGALTAADSLLTTGPTGETAVRAFAYKAQALEALDKTDDAVAAWLRIPAHYPSSPQAPAALTRAAELQLKLDRKDQAAALLKELQENYPDSAQAEALKK